jgi:hypothetical protein
LAQDRVKTQLEHLGHAKHSAFAIKTDRSPSRVDDNATSWTVGQVPFDLGADSTTSLVVEVFIEATENVVTLFSHRNRSAFVVSTIGRSTLNKVTV